MPRSRRKRPALARSSGSARGTSTIGNPERLRVNAPSFSRWSRIRRVLDQSTARRSSPLASLTWSPTSTLASEATGDGPEYRYGGAVTLSRRLSSDGQATKASRGRVGLGEAAGEHHVV